MSFIFDLVPWWLVVGILLVALALTAFGLWPLAIKAFRAVPPSVWIALAVLYFGWRFLAIHDQRVIAERDAYWKGREEQANKGYEKNATLLNRKLEDAGSAAMIAAAHHAVALADANAKVRIAFTQLEAERKRNVTAEANRLCTLTRGVIVQFNAGASRANGADPGDGAPAAGAGGAAVDEPAGISLDLYTGAVGKTQAALGTCRTQVLGWQSYHANVIKPWIASTLEALSMCIPKGIP